MWEGKMFIQRNNIIKNIQEKDKILIFCFIAIFILYHVVVRLNFGDDITFSNVLNEVTLNECLISCYETWSSRILIHTILVFITRVPIIWRILDCFLWLFVTQSMIKLIGMKTWDEYFLIGFMMIVYPFWNMGEAGWMATTVNYIWPLAALLVVCKFNMKYIQGKRIDVWNIIGLFLALLFAGNHEQSVVLLFATIVCAAVKNFHMRKKGMLLFLIELMIVVIELIFILTTPGNVNRKQVELNHVMGGYEDLNVIEKLYLGLMKTESVFIAVPNMVFITFCVLLFVIMVKKKNKIDIISFIPVLILLFPTTICSFLPNYDRIFFVPEERFIIDWNSYKTYLPLCWLFIIIVCIICTIYRLFKDSLFDFWFLVFLLATGFATNVVMGWSPTVYLSGNRTSAFLYFILIFVSGFLLHRYCFIIKINKMWTGIMVIGAAVSAINVLGCMLSTYV